MKSGLSSFRCCLRAIADIQSTQSQSLRPRRLPQSQCLRRRQRQHHQQQHSFTTSSILQTTNLTQGQSPGQTLGIPLPEEGVKSAADAAAQAAGEAQEIANLLEQDPDLRIVPDSSSYFTGASAFYDAWLEAQDLLRKYETLPTVSAEEAPRPSWKSLAQYRMDSIGTSIQASKYTKILNILRRLNRIDPRLQPEDVKLALQRFTKASLQKLDQSKRHFLDDEGRAYAIGRRKESSAQVWLVEGTGGVLINGVPLSKKFVRIHDRESVIWPLLVTDRLGNYNIWAKVAGGGTTGQAEALTLGVARALMIHEPLLKPVLRRAGVVTRDPRMVERKKHGKLKARKMPAWVRR